MSDLLQRLKERKLVQWALAYAAGAFALLQGVDIVAQRFGWPESIERALIVALAVGFFVMLVVAWYHGERGVQRVSGTELTILALLLAIGGAILWRFAPADSERAAAATHKIVVTGVPAGTATVPGKSIAVLPFENLSDDKSNAYFAEGIQDEILTRLSRIADLKVISRTSTAKYKSAPDNLREIANQLGVANILEGSVQKSNDQVRVNVQLINAMTDAHLWADIYDRKLTDIFVVESDVAKTIADTLQAKLSGSEQRALAARPTENAEAYQLYLKGRYFWNKRTAGDLLKSIDLFNQAIARDPNYALAYAAMAQSELLVPGYDGGPPKEWFPKAEAAAKRALTLDDASSDAHAALGMVKQLYRFDTPGAIAEFERAIQLNPNDATAHHWLANHSFAVLGQVDREIAGMKRALELDPLSLIINTNLSQGYVYARRWDDAIAQARKTLDMDGTFYPAHDLLGMALELKGQTVEADAEFRRAISLTDDQFPSALLGHLCAVTGRRDEAETILQHLRSSQQTRYVHGYDVALVELGLGHRDAALSSLEEAYRNGDGFDMAPIRIDPYLEPLHGDPRFEALADKIVPTGDFTPVAAPAK